MMQKYREAILYIVLLMILCYGAIMQIKPKLESFISTRREIIEKKQTATQLQSQLESAKLQAQKLEKARIANGILSKVIFDPQTLSLDSESGYSVMFNDIFEMAKNNKIKTFSVQYEYNPTDDPFVTANKGYSVCLLKMKLIGDYADFENFLTDLYKYPYFLSISSYDLVPYYKDKSILLIKLGVRVYMLGGNTAPVDANPVNAVPPAAGQ